MLGVMLMRVEELPKLTLYLFALMLCSCTEARMALSPQLRSSAVEYPVSGREGLVFSGEFKFGPFEVVRVKRGWLEMSTLSFAGLSRSKTEDSFEFELRSPEGVWTGRCAGGLLQSQLEVSSLFGGNFSWRLSADTDFVCRLSGPKGSGDWQLLMRQGSADAALSGMLRTRTDMFEVRGISALADSPLGLGRATGYEFRYHGRLAGGVEVLNAGRVWIVPSACCPREAMTAAVSAALLLYRDRRFE